MPSALIASGKIIEKAPHHLAACHPPDDAPIAIDRLVQPPFPMRYFLTHRRSFKNRIKK